MSKHTARCKEHRPLTTNGHMVQNPPCWRSSSLLFPHWDVKIKASQPHLHYIYLALQNTVDIIATFQKSCWDVQLAKRQEWQKGWHPYCWQTVTPAFLSPWTTHRREWGSPQCSVNFLHLHWLVGEKEDGGSTMRMEYSANVCCCWIILTECLGSCH